LLSETLAIAAWGGVIAFWLVSAWISLRWLLQGPATAKNADEDLFREAQANYLQANWFDVEVTLGRLLERQPRDVEARLLLTTLYRHTGRFDEAEAQLRVLEKLDGAVKWQMEIRQERALVADAREEPSEKTGDQLPWSNVVPFASAA
jgi:thioredoxin-like negative regulator of GroEL